jgi:sulfite reductase (NADPH) hemoprotein beta-component
MKFMIRSLGWSRFREEYERELAACRLRGSTPPLEIDPPAAERAPDWVKDSSPSVGHIASRVGAQRITGPGLVPPVVPVFRSGDDEYARWRATNVRPQRQFGYMTAVATLPLGDITSAQLRVVGELARAYGDGTVRVTPDQNLLFRWVNACDVRQLHRRLCAAGLGLAESGTIADVASCPGAETCRLAVTQSRGLGRVLEDHLRSRPDLIAAADGARIKISGCPNGCGQHHVATIGFQGSVRRIGTRAVPQYFVMVGGGAGDGGSVNFARLAAKIPARRIPDVVDRLIAMYTRERSENESAESFFSRVDIAVVKSELADLERLQPGDAMPADFIDLGEASEFAPEVMEGECSA